jgi:hypothetical protein
MIITVPIVQPASSWTHKRIMSEVMWQLSSINNNKLQTSHIRNKVNMGLSYIAELMSLASSPWYRIALGANFETTLHDCGLPYIKLQPAKSSWLLIPQGISSVERVTINKRFLVTGLSGNIIRKDISELIQLATGQNDKTRQSAFWAQAGSDLIFSFGNEWTITTTNPMVPVPVVLAIPSTPFITRININADDITDNPVTVWVQRVPLQDDLLPPTKSSTFRGYADIPDKFIKILIDFTVRYCLYELGQINLQQLEQGNEQNAQQITQSVMSEIQTEVSQKMAQKTGMESRKARL